MSPLKDSDQGLEQQNVGGSSTETAQDFAQSQSQGTGAMHLPDNSQAVDDKEPYEPAGETAGNSKQPPIDTGQAQALDPTDAGYNRVMTEQEQEEQQTRSA